MLVSAIECVIGPANSFDQLDPVAVGVPDTKHRRGAVGHRCTGAHSGSIPARRSCVLEALDRGSGRFDPRRGARIRCRRVIRLGADLNVVASLDPWLGTVSATSQNTPTVSCGALAAERAGIEAQRPPYNVRDAQPARFVRDPTAIASRSSSRLAQPLSASQPDPDRLPDRDHRALDGRSVAVEHLPGGRRARPACRDDRRRRSGRAAARRARPHALSAHSRLADPPPPRPCRPARPGARPPSRHPGLDPPARASTSSRAPPEPWSRGRRSSPAPWRSSRFIRRGIRPGCSRCWSTARTCSPATPCSRARSVASARPASTTYADLRVLDHGHAADASRRDANPPRPHRSDDGGRRVREQQVRPHLARASIPRARSHARRSESRPRSILLGDDYDGGYKAWVRWPDGSDDIVPGSRVRRARRRLVVVAKDKIPTSRVGRTAKIGGLAAGQAIRQAGTRAANVARNEEPAPGGAGASAHRGRRADRGRAGDDEGRRDEGRPGDVVPRRRSRARGVPRGVSAQARRAARRGAHGQLQATCAR